MLANLIAFAHFSTSEAISASNSRGVMNIVSRSGLYSPRFEPARIGGWHDQWLARAPNTTKLASDKKTKLEVAE